MNVCSSMNFFPIACLQAPSWHQAETKALSSLDTKFTSESEQSELQDEYWTLLNISFWNVLCYRNMWRHSVHNEESPTVLPRSWSSVQYSGGCRPKRGFHFYYSSCTYAYLRCWCGYLAPAVWMVCFIIKINIDTLPMAKKPSFDVLTA